MTRGRFTFLDGIRGIASIFVVMIHTPELMHFRIFRSYLAVDLFFMLSGFVIAHAYDTKIESGQITISRFFRTRITRLYPTYLLSILVSCIAALAFYESKLSFTNIALTAGLSLLFIPAHLPINNSLFPLNVAHWSLLYELVVNMMYALIRPILNSRRMLLIIGGAGLMLIVCAFHYGSLDVGSSWGIPNAVTAGSRSIFGFFVGIFMYQNQATLSRKFVIHPFFTLALITICLAFPSFGKYDAVIDLAAVLIIFPLCVLSASQSESRRFESTFLILGSASYPVYVLHVPLSQLLRYSIAPGTSWAFIGIPFILSLILIGVLVEKYYDIPVRRWLSGRPRAARGGNALAALKD
jgi:peptidoglycan/LPS O-acetylase OafA/YrhL